MYDWLIHTTEKTWVTPQDANDLIVAFLIAVKEYQVEANFDIKILTNSVIEQRVIINDKDL